MTNFRKFANRAICNSVQEREGIRIKSVQNLGNLHPKKVLSVEREHTKEGAQNLKKLKEFTNRKIC